MWLNELRCSFIRIKWEIFTLILALLVGFFITKSHSQSTTDDVKVEFESNGNGSLPSVYITCSNNLWTKLPNIKHDTPFVSSVMFMSCNFSATVNVPNIIRSINIESFNELSFSRCIPRRQNLKGLMTRRLEFFVIDLSELPFDLLYDVDEVGSLRIENTHLAHIPKQFFSRLVNVNTINLFNNRIKVIEPGTFDRLIHLHTVKLSANKLQTLPDGIFHQTTNLASIQMGYNLFNELPHDLLVNTRKLEYFASTNNKGNITTLAPGFFKNLTHLEVINLSSNQMQNLPADLFAGCSALETVHLYSNQLKNLPSGLFDDNENLKELLLDENHLESLPSRIFKNLNRLKILRLNNNRLTSLTSKNLEGLHKILFFDASHNYLKHIDHHFIIYLRSALVIRLEHNQLTFDNRGQTELSENQKRSSLRNSLIENSTTTLEKQSIVQCNFDRDIKKTKLLLNNNNITKLHAALVNVIKYNKFVDLSYNHISNINLSELSSGFALCNRTNTDENESERVYINVGHNPLHCDCRVTDLVNYLNRQDDDGPYNIIAVMSETSKEGFLCVSPPKFKNHEVRDLHLEELGCLVKTAIPEDACHETCTCREYTGIQIFSVDCSYRNLTRLPPVIQNVRNWSIELNMSGNMLLEAPFLRDSYLTYVTTLDLSNNNITRVTMDNFSPKLQILKLHGNNMSRLDSKVINHLVYGDTLRNITLHNNKWICDCEARELINFIRNKFESYNFSEVRCYGTNRKPYKMIASELCPDTIVIIVVASLSLTLLAIFIASSIALYHKYQDEIKFWLYSKQWCLWLVTEDELDKDKEYDAFISFSNKDLDFVEREIIAKLEGGLKPYKLCLHHRDWLAGEWIPAQISRSVAESKRTIIILTPNFLESVWGLIEFKTAHTQALKEGRTRLIVIICEGTGDTNDLDQEMKEYLRLNTYIKWGDPWFWDKLTYALPRAKELMMRKTQKAVDIVETYSTQLPQTNDVNTNVNKGDDVILLSMHAI